MTKNNSLSTEQQAFILRDEAGTYITTRPVNNNHLIGGNPDIVSFAGQGLLWPHPGPS